jgi:hypothetical protein
MFDHIRSLLQTAVGYPKSPSSHEIDRFRWVVAGCARKIAGQQLVPHDACPFCLSRNLSVDDCDPVADRLVEDASYDEFLAKTVMEQVELVKQLWEQSSEYCQPPPSTKGRKRKGVISRCRPLFDCDWFFRAGKRG